MLVESLIKNTVELQGFRVLSVVMGEGGLLAKLGPDGRYLPRRSVSQPREGVRGLPVSVEEPRLGQCPARSSAGVGSSGSSVVQCRPPLPRLACVTRPP